MSYDLYSKYLQGRYDYMNTGTTSMQGVPTTVSVSSAFLRKCMNDPEKAKYLEENLSAIPDCVKSLVNYTKTMAGIEKGCQKAGCENRERRSRDRNGRIYRKCYGYGYKSCYSERNISITALFLCKDTYKT